MTSSNTKLLTPSAAESFWETALWTSTGNDDKPLDRDYGIEDIHIDTRSLLEKECEDFLRRLSEEGLLEKAISKTNLETIMHDFWLTRNGQGAGFWDGDYDEDFNDNFGQKLTDVAKEFGSVELYVGDDGVIYGCGYEVARS